jgi:hypothetical protein
MESFFGPFLGPKECPIDVELLLQFPVFFIEFFELPLHVQSKVFPNANDDFLCRILSIVYLLFFLAKKI